MTDETTILPDNGEEHDWGAIGEAGVALRVRRMPDGSAIFGTFHVNQEAPPYFLQLSPEATMALIDYLLNKPAGGVN